MNANTQNLVPQELETMLARDIHTTQELLDLLQRERELLELREHDALPELIQRKAQCLESLDSSAAQRRSWLKAAGLAHSPSGWETLMQTKSEALQAQWGELRDYLSQCRECNDINGKMISRSRQTLGKLLDLLRGQVAQPQLYTASGEASGQGGGQTVAKA